MPHSFQNRIRRVAILVTIIALWGGAFRASLAIAELDLGYAAGLCGAWGCLPQTAPLLSVHAMWLTLILGGAWLARLAVPLLRSPAPWLGMTCAAMLATLVLLGFDTYTYLEKGGTAADVGRRALFCLCTWTDLPLVQIIATCSVNWWAAVALASR
ncbi:MAG TPA: hypothetical protein DDW52_26130 [Planctomycetaceae bacterium]|nr:hypothetical protein [Planctomycetaceae bacterium]